MRRIVRKCPYLCAVICLMLVIAMTVTILPEPVQAATTSGFTMDLADLNSPMTFQSYGKAGPGGAGLISTSLVVPEGETIYIEDGRNTCEGQYIYKIFYEGRLWTTYASDVVDLNSTEYTALCNRVAIDLAFGEKPLEPKKNVVVGDVMDPYHYYYVYAEPKVTDANCIGAVAVGAKIQVVKEKYNSKWAKILWHGCPAYIQRDCLNSEDAYLADLDLRSQQDIKLAKKAKLTYKGILKDYGDNLTKKEFCRLAVSWYKATGHKLPKQSKKSPYSDTKDSYVIMAYQLGIIKAASNKKFQPNKELTGDEYHKLMKSMVKAAKQPAGLYDYVCQTGGSGVTRVDVLREFYRLYRMLQKKDYLLSNDSWRYGDILYTISPADNADVCLDVWGWDNANGAEIGLYEKSGGDNQKFFLFNVNGFTTINNQWSQKTLAGTTEKVYQDRIWYECEKMSFEYNKDGTVCIKNGDGLYLDIKDGEAVSGAHLIFAPKSGKSSQKFVFNLVKKK